MNAAEKATGLAITSKIAALVNLFKSHFADAKADLKPWQNDPDTRSFIDPDSIDIGFHFPGWSPKFQCRSILVQIRMYKESEEQNYRLIGIEAVGFNHTGEAWRVSTVDNWEFMGKFTPNDEVKKQLKIFCREVFDLFGGLQDN